MPRLPRRLRPIASAAAVLLLAAGSGVGCTREEAPPRLALLLVVDQLLPQRLDPSLPGGLGRLAREGRVFVDAAIDFSDTETFPGHVAAVTGRYPGAIGVIGNHYFDPESGRPRYCVEDDAETTRVLGGSGGRSPRAIGASALGDWLQEKSPASRVFGVSAKDRSAIALGGQRAQGAWWLESEAPEGWTTSAHYRADLPDWVQRFNGTGPKGGFLAGLPAVWEHPSGQPANGAHRDDQDGEIEALSRVSPHPIAAPDRQHTLEQLLATPFLDDVTLDFARELVVREGIGRGEAVDLLGISLSATDIVGHYYGPDSQEARDALLRLDVSLGRFLEFLERRIGRGRLLVALTSDHGVLPLPERLIETGRGECRVPSGRVDLRGLMAAIQSSLDGAFGAGSAKDGPWVFQASFRLAVNRARARAAGVSDAAVASRVRSILEGQPVVARVWTAQEMESGAGPAPFSALYQRSHHPQRGGDLAVQIAQGCLVSPYAAGTSHGTPYVYDRAVPLVFLGPGVQAGRSREPSRLVDLAPTLATLLGVDPPAGLDGRALRVVDASAAKSRAQ